MTLEPQATTEVTQMVFNWNEGKHWKETGQRIAISKNLTQKINQLINLYGKDQEIWVGGANEG